MYFAIILTLLFSSWMAVSILYQFKFRALQPIKKFDTFGLIPTWTFFAPRPISKDYQLVLGISDQHRECVDWVDLNLVVERRFFHWFWNPNQRINKVIGDIIRSLRKISSDNSIDSVIGSFQYVLLLNYLAHREMGISYNKIQFVILVSHGFIDKTGPQVLLKSNEHKV